MTAPPSPRPRSRFTPGHALFAWAFMILILSVLPVAPPPQTQFILSDKLFHAAFYAPLGLLFLLAFPRGRSRFWVFARAALAGAAYGFMIELIQAILPWRFFEFADAAANLVGAAFGAGVALMFPNSRIK